MTCETPGPGALDYYPCHYGASKLVFRGPRRDLEAPYVSFIGGTQTFGKFIEQPYPLKVEHLTGVTSVNFGQVNAGLDVFAKAAVVVEASRAARVTVMEVLGAANLSNRLYTVHSRRNDRFLKASSELQKLYPETDFTQFNFTRHMLLHLYQQDEDRFVVVRRSLQRVWKRRMRQLLAHLGDNVVLLRIAKNGLDQNTPAGPLCGPVLVTDAMLDGLKAEISAFVDVIIGPDAGGIESAGMSFGDLEIQAARAVAPPKVHTAAALALMPVLDRLM